MYDINRPALLDSAGILDPDYVPQQSPMVDERDPYAIAQDMLRQRGIEAESEIEKIKGDKWGKIFNAIGAFGAGIQGRDASRYSLQGRIQPHQDTLHQAQNGMADLALQRQTLQQKLGQGDTVGSPLPLANGNYGIMRKDAYGNPSVFDTGVPFDPKVIKMGEQFYTTTGGRPSALLDDDEKDRNRQDVVDTEGDKATEKTRRTTTENRNAAYIQAGMDAVDALPDVMSAIDLLDEVDTGGWSKVLVRAKKLLGVETADEGELDYLLSKSVLSQLKAIFGSAFTAGEGERLDKIEAGLSRNRESNRRILDRAISSWERNLKRARLAAEHVNDPIGLAEVDEASEMLDLWKAKRQELLRGRRTVPAPASRPAAAGGQKPDPFGLLGNN